MITACFTTQNGLFRGFTITGHSDYSEEGHDIVCAAMSAMANLTTRILEENGIKCNSSADGAEPRYTLKVKTDFELASKIIGGFYCEAGYVAEDYPEDLTVKKQELTEKEKK